MQKFIKLKDREIEYTIKVSQRSRSIRLAVNPGGRVVVTVSRFIPQFIVNRFLSDKSDWLLDKIDKLSKFAPLKTKKEVKKEYLKYKDIALKIAEDRLKYFNKFYNYKWDKVTIKNQKTRWGSCSKKGNLNFNYKIALLTPSQADYIIVHELCHLKEFNHSSKFWNLVAITIPKHKEIRNSLRNNTLKLS